MIPRNSRPQQHNKALRQYSKSDVIHDYLADMRCPPLGIVIISTLYSVEPRNTGLSSTEVFHQVIVPNRLVSGGLVGGPRAYAEYSRKNERM